jgi:acyl-CoA synthetase (AMP-forming)/AMP-acid ligase II
MGLIGMVAGVVTGVTHHLWSPVAFVRGPGQWLEQLSGLRGTIYAGPSFSYAAMLSRVTDAQLSGLDLSRWRIAFNGSEVIHAATLAAFQERFAAAGLRPSALFPVYGLAEATLAVTFPRLGAVPFTEWVDRDALANRRVRCEVPRQAPEARGLVGVGSPVKGHEVRISGADRNPLPDRCIGEIEVRGPAVMASYLGKSPAESGVSHDGWFRTGDLGYRSGENLFVSGRTKEMIIVRGANYYPQDVEAAVAGLPGIYKNRVVAFSLGSDGAERMAVMVESAAAEVDRLVKGVRHALLESVGLGAVDVCVVKPRSLARTTSGKYQRLLMRDRLISRTLSGSLVRWDVAASASH